MASSLRGGRIASLTMTVIAGLALAGCTAAAGQQVRSGRPAPTSGTVIGKFIRVGGPIGPGGTQPKVVRLSGVIEFTSPAHSVVKVRVGKSGTFSIGLAAGTYSVSGQSPSLRVVSGNGSGQGRPMPCSQPRKVRVRAGRLAKITVTCAVP
jgi:hypothetical protein